MSLPPLPLREILRTVRGINNFFQFLVLIYVLGMVALLSLAASLPEQRVIVVISILILTVFFALLVVYLAIRHDLFAPLPRESANDMAIDLYTGLLGSISNLGKDEQTEAWRALIDVFKNPRTNHRGLADFQDRVATSLERLAKMPAVTTRGLGVIDDANR